MSSQLSPKEEAIAKKVVDAGASRSGTGLIAMLLNQVSVEKNIPCGTAASGCAITPVHSRGRLCYMTLPRIYGKRELGIKSHFYLHPVDAAYTVRRALGPGLRNNDPVRGKGHATMSFSLLRVSASPRLPLISLVSFVSWCLGGWTS